MRARAQVTVKHPLFQHPVLGGIADQIVGSHLGGALFEEDNAAMLPRRTARRSTTGTTSRAARACGDLAPSCRPNPRGKGHGTYVLSQP